MFVGSVFTYFFFITIMSGVAFHMTDQRWAY